MRYDFECDECGETQSVFAKAFTPPHDPQCDRCGKLMDRVFGCEMDTSSCKDADDVAPAARLNSSPHGGNAFAKEKRYHAALEKRRKVVREGGHSDQFRMTHQVPAELFHGKIKETGDKDYWRDSKNMNRHRSCKVG